jgi:MFS family permease
MTVFTTDILKVNTTWLGVLLGASGAGALAGSIALMALPNKKRGLMLLVSGLVAGASLAAFAFSSMLGFSLAMMAILGITMAFRGTISAALTQAYAEAPFMGRVMSLLNIQWGIAAVCTFIVGIAATGWGVQWVVGGMAMLLFVISILFFMFSSKMRKVE